MRRSCIFFHRWIELIELCVVAKTQVRLNIIHNILYISMLSIRYIFLSRINIPFEILMFLARYISFLFFAKVYYSSFIMHVLKQSIYLLWHQRIFTAAISTWTSNAYIVTYHDRHDPLDIRIRVYSNAIWESWSHLIKCLFVKLRNKCMYWTILRNLSTSYYLPLEGTFSPLIAHPLRLYS